MGVIFLGNGDLKGDEVEFIIVFKNVLGLDDFDVVVMYIEVEFLVCDFFVWSIFELFEIIFCVLSYFFYLCVRL